MMTTTDNIFTKDYQTSEDFFKDLTLHLLEKGDRASKSNDPAYLRARTTAISYFEKGEYKKAYLELQNYLGTNYSNLNEELNFVDKNILRILAEQETAVITKADLLNLLKKN